MIKLTKTLSAWNDPDFGNVCKNEIQQLDASQLPLQEGLTRTSVVSNSNHSVIILRKFEKRDFLCVQTSILYGGIIAGSCCADDPSSVDEITEKCDVLFEIDKSNAETLVSLITG